MDNSRLRYQSPYDQPMYASPSFPAQVHTSLTLSPPSEMDNSRLQYPSLHDQPEYASPSFPTQVHTSLTLSPPSEKDNSHLQHSSLHDQPEYVSPSSVDSTNHRVTNSFVGSHDANPYDNFPARPSQPAHAMPSMIARPDGRPYDPYRMPEQPLAHPAKSYPLQLEQPSPPQSLLGSSYPPAGMAYAPEGAQHPSIKNPGRLANAFVSLPVPNVRKRPRRRYDEIERLYSCSFEGCSKAYGTLNHLNAHVAMEKHGPMRHPSEFKELRKLWRHQKRAAEQLVNHPHGYHSHGDHPHGAHVFGGGDGVTHVMRTRTSRPTSTPADGYGDNESDEETSQSDDSQQQEEHGVGQGRNSLPLLYNVQQGRFRSRSPNVGY